MAITFVQTRLVKFVFNSTPSQLGNQSILTGDQSLQSFHIFVQGVKRPRNYLLVTLICFKERQKIGKGVEESR